MKTIILKNRKSKFLNLIVKHKLNVFDYNNLIDQTIANFDDIYDNGIPGNYIYQPSSLQIQEMYSRGDLHAIKKIFYNLLRHSDKSSLEKNKSQIDKCLIDLQEDKYLISTTFFHDLVIKPNSIKKYFKFIKITVESIGSSFFKIIFNCYFSDFFYYNLWLASTSNFIPVVEFSWNPFKGFTYKSTSGLESKKATIARLEKESYICIKKFLKINAPGIFCTFIKDFPCTLCSKLTKNIDIYKKINTSFFDSIIDSFSDHNERYIANNGFGVFIPILINSKSFSKMYLKYFHDGTTHLPNTSDLSWFSILHFLLSSELKLLTEIKNRYYHYDLYKHKICFPKEKRKINRISTIIQIVKEPYEILSTHISGLYNNSQIIRITEFFNHNSKEPVNYVINYNNRINYLLDKIASEMNYINVIYQDRYNINNDRKNIALQWMAIILTAVTVTQPIIQCKIDKKNLKEDSEKQNKIINNFNEKIDDHFSHLEELIDEVHEKQTEDQKIIIEDINVTQQRKIDELINKIDAKK